MMTKCNDVASLIYLPTLSWLRKDFMVDVSVVGSSNQVRQKQTSLRKRLIFRDQSGSNGAASFIISKSKMFFK